MNLRLDHYQKKYFRVPFNRWLLPKQQCQSTLCEPFIVSGRAACISGYLRLPVYLLNPFFYPRLTSNNLIWNNFWQRISWLSQRWRTQRNAIRSVNCRTVNHRIFERILRLWVSLEACLFENHLTHHPQGWSLGSGIDGWIWAAAVWLHGLECIDPTLDPFYPSQSVINCGLGCIFHCALG